jgi:hypothetical protein
MKYLDYIKIGVAQGGELWASLKKDLAYINESHKINFETSCQS